MSTRKTVYQNWIVDLGMDPQNADFTEPNRYPVRPNRKIIEAVQQALKKLSPRERNIVEKYYFEGESKAALSMTLGIEPERLEYIFRKAINKLRNHLAGFVKNQFGVETGLEPACRLCESVFRQQIDKLILARKKEETWKKTIAILKNEFFIEITTPQIIISHLKYHI